MSVDLNNVAPFESESDISKALFMRLTGLSSSAVSKLEADRILVKSSNSQRGKVRYTVDSVHLWLRGRLELATRARQAGNSTGATETGSQEAREIRDTAMANAAVIKALNEAAVMMPAHAALSEIATHLSAANSALNNLPSIISGVMPRGKKSIVAKEVRKFLSKWQADIAEEIKQKNAEANSHRTEYFRILHALRRGELITDVDPAYGIEGDAL